MHSLRLHTPELSSSDSSSDSNGSDGEDLTITIPLAAVPLSQQRDPEDNLDEDEGRVGTKFRRRVRSAFESFWARLITDLNRR